MIPAVSIPLVNRGHWGSTDSMLSLVVFRDGHGNGHVHGHGYDHGYGLGYDHGYGLGYGHGPTHNPGLLGRPGCPGVPASHEQRGHAAGDRIVCEHAARAPAAFFLAGRAEPHRAPRECPSRELLGPEADLFRIRVGSQQLRERHVRSRPVHPTLEAVRRDRGSGCGHCRGFFVAPTSRGRWGHPSSALFHRRRGRLRYKGTSLIISSVPVTDMNSGAGGRV